VWVETFTVETSNPTPPTDAISSHLSWSIFISTLRDADGDANDDADDDADDLDAVIFFNQLGQPPLQCCIGGSLHSADVDQHQFGPARRGGVPTVQHSSWQQSLVSRHLMMWHS
jgi:hypothetical protein